MRKLYLPGLMAFTLMISSYIVDHPPYAGFTDSTERLAHFYPNPATSYINFVFDKSVNRNYSLMVYNFIGRKMNEIRITESKITINFNNNYFRGIYIYQLRDQSGRIIESGKFQVEK